MIRLSTLLEKSTGVYSKGCVMVELQFEQLTEIQDKIKPEWLYEDPTNDSYGLEDQPHITLLYGIDPSTPPSQVKQVLGDWKPRTYYNIHSASVFQSERYDVVKYDVYADDLHRANKLLCQLPHQNDYPDYHPHITIGYVKSGLGEWCAKQIGRGTMKLPVKRVVYKQNQKLTIL